MVKAALYARVSTERQREEATIASQVFELKRQIAAAGHELVREYIDDGYSGAYLDRPALDAMRAAVKTNTYDAVYFLCPDRIARDVLHQNIIISELVLSKKRIIISGKDYEENPENKFALTVFGAVAEFERAKITERMARGKLHRLRQGQIAGGGVAPYGYHYVPRTPEHAAALAVCEPEAAIVRWMFETCAAGGSLRGIARSLEARDIPTKLGKVLWRPEQIGAMLKNHTYVGMRYFNRVTEEKTPERKRGKLRYRERTEWIGVSVSALVSAELFDAVQMRLAKNFHRYRQPATHYLLSGLVECGECGAAVCSYRRYYKKELAMGTKRVYHKSAYKCRWRARQLNHAATRIERCYNPEIATHALEGIVLDLFREIVCDPVRLLERIERPKRIEQGERGMPQRFAGIATHMVAIEDERRRLIELYATERMEAAEYIEANRALDEKLARLKRERNELAADIRPVRRDALLEASVRQFSDQARVGIEACNDLEATKQFLAEHVERVIYADTKVEIIGSIAVRNGMGETEHVPFRIERKIDRRALHATLRPALPGDGQVRDYNSHLTSTLAQPVP
jgi:DNA invertase Pin-like site-specific DNA recombinase